MKKIIAGIIIAIVGCVSIPAWVDAQPRDGGRGRGRGIAEQDRRGGARGERRSYRGRQQRRRYYGGRYEWYEDPADAARAIGGFFGGLFKRQAEPEPEPEPEAMTDEASLEPWSPGWIAYCKRKYKSFDIKDGRYLSYDGNRYFCK